MDMRDPWFGEWESKTSNSKLLASLYQNLFFQCARQATKIITNTDRLRLHLCQSLPDLADRLIAIPNGCAPPTEIQKRPGGIAQRFHIGHYGNLYHQRTAEKFIQGLHLWMNRNR